MSYKTVNTVCKYCTRAIHNMDNGEEADRRADGSAAGKNRKNTAIDKINGAITLEAALILPLVLCVFLSAVFVIKAVYAYGLIQHALNETASEIASSCYIYHLSGMRDIHDTVRDGINDRADIFSGQLESLLEVYGSQDGFLGEAGEIDGNAVSNPVDELKNAAAYILSGTLEGGKTLIAAPVVKLYMKKYFATEEGMDADSRLKSLFVKNGFDGLDFSGSSFWGDTDDNIDLVVAYSIKLPLPIQLIGDLKFVQRTKVKAWMGVDETKGVLDGTITGEDIWSLPNFERGNKIRKLFGANLPSNFPVIAAFNNGNAIMIKSMDLTAKSYQTGNNAKKTIEGYIKKLSDFEGQETPWGASGTVVRKNDIKTRELLLVIPENDLPAAIEELLREMGSNASANGVKLTITRYGKKTEEQSTEQSTGQSSEEGAEHNTKQGTEQGTE